LVGQKLRNLVDGTVNFAKYRISKKIFKLSSLYFLMVIKKRKVFMVFLVFLFIIQFISAHVEHAEIKEEAGILYQIFLFHDWVHPVFFILLVYSCYYFRFFYGRNISREPKACLGNCSEHYKSEGWLKQHHRYFFWGTLILSFIHVGELMPSIMGIFNLSGLDLLVLISESSYLAFAFLYLGTCYHFRYFVERLAHKGYINYQLYNKLTELNRHHNLFFWITILFVAVRFTLVAIDTGSIVDAIPGTF
jgi:hypothetical protein